MSNQVKGVSVSITISVSVTSSSVLILLQTKLNRVLNFLACGCNPKMWPSKGNLLSISCLAIYYAVCKVSFGRKSLSVTIHLKDAA